jgi:membrane protein implicated in regulation of membrane protease activity
VRCCGIRTNYDNYFATRLTSDMAERGHSLQYIRGLTSLGEQFLRGLFGLLVTAVGLIWIDPSGGLSVAVVFAWRYFRKRDRWTEARITLTNDLVERMVGHRTRLAQQRRSRQHDGEDDLLADYVEQSRQMDGTLVRFSTFAGRGWLLVGVAALIPLTLSLATAVAALGVALGGILLASRALGSAGRALAGAAAALVAWRQVRELLSSLPSPQKRTERKAAETKPPRWSIQRCMRGLAVESR